MRDDCQFKLTDFGAAGRINKHFTLNIETLPYRSPEGLLEADYDAASDIWSLACTIFEIATGDNLFDPKCVNNYSNEEDHLVQIIELLGEIPPKLIHKGRLGHQFFNKMGKLQKVQHLDPWGLVPILIQRYELPIGEAENFADFLLPMLALDPLDRKSAGEMLRHPWLQMRGCTNPAIPISVRPHSSGKRHQKRIV